MARLKVIKMREEENHGPMNLSSYLVKCGIAIHLADNGDRRLGIETAENLTLLYSTTHCQIPLT